jgi:hypothetical protein
MHSIQDQIVAIADFSARNDLEIVSADHEFHRLFIEQPELADAMRDSLGDEFFSTLGHWAFFSLNGKQGPFEFPAVAGRQTFAHQSAVVVEGVRFPATVVAKAQPWSFASAWAWRPLEDVPRNVETWLRVRMQVEDGSVGVGLLAANGTDFTVRRAVAPGEAVDVQMPVADLANRGQLVVTTWAAPRPARVRVDDVRLVW